ncbi:DUF3078 domain-containing protein [Marinilabilia rubra]|uniref:DUF3078 domain-containing protein n=1 Tax=Marinilabilia rubra TaxID=2162893 RepID=A0A2U2B6Y2_9BACT|nr:DUF3078 domain-containing protein [Marinilabilia rubra]PWD98830.1 hypothetical protein DDZ16_13925 [Marinilabilia rubra]
MVKKFFLLHLFLIVYCFSAAQVISVDSVEVSIIIPDHHKKEILSIEDSVKSEVSARFADYLLKVDSLFPDSNIVSFDRVKLLLPNFYNQLVRSGMLDHRIQSFLLFDPSLKPDFNPYSLSTKWPQPPEYKPFSLSLKYKSRDYDPVVDFPSEYASTPLNKYRSFLQHPSGVDTLYNHLEQSPVKKAMSQLVIEKPYQTDEVWDSIPEPPKISYGDGYIEKKNADDVISKLIKWESPETKKQLDKKEEIKRKWTYGGTENIQLSQAYADNWVKGGENSVSLLSDLRINARYKKNDVEWESYAIHKLGILQTEEKKGRINDDLIELNTKYGLKAGKKWFYSGLFNFKTQFFDGYKKNDVDKENPISGFLAPGYVTMALGMDYKEKNFTLMLLPFTNKLTIVADTVKFDQTRYDVDKDKKTDNMGGASLVNKLKWSMSKDFNLVSNLDFFYEYMGTDNQIQAEWELILDMKINIFLSTRISTYLRYYKNESDKLQFREIMSISFSYKF